MSTAEARLFHKAEAKNAAYKHVISSFLLEKFAKGDKLHRLPSVGLVAEKGPYSWVEGAYFLGKRGISQLHQHEHNRSGTITLETVDGQGTKNAHFLLIRDELPVVTLHAQPLKIDLVDQVYALSNENGRTNLQNPKSPEMVVLHIPREFKRDKRPGQKVVIEKAVFVDVPEEVQSQIGVKLASAHFLVATKIRPLAS